jgi:hypothetical protein
MDIQGRLLLHVDVGTEISCLLPGERNATELLKPLLPAVGQDTIEGLEETR